MTFDIESFSVQPLMCEADIPNPKGNERHTHDNPKTPPVRQKDVKNDFCEDTQISNWEDEGGAYAHSPDVVFRDRSLNLESVLSVHIDSADALMSSGDYDGAFRELQASTEVFISYRNRINSSFNNSIAQLSTLGCRATPPHPRALPLVKLHQQIAP